MRLGLSICLVGALLPLGCFDEPPASSSGDGTTASTGRETDATMETSSGSADGSTSAAATTIAATTDVATTDVATTSMTTTGGPLERELLLHPLTCTEASWQAGPMELACETPKIGPYVDVRDNYTFGGQSFERVIEARPPNMVFAPVDGVYEIDTSEFTAPVFRSQVACGTGNNCEIGFEITAESGDRILSNWQGAVAEGDDVVEVTLDLPSQEGLIIHLNISVTKLLGDSQFLWIDPRVVEASE